MSDLDPVRMADESAGIADYYRGAFGRCERCGSRELHDGVVCYDCSVELDGGAP